MSIKKQIKVRRRAIRAERRENKVGAVEKAEKGGTLTSQLAEMEVGCKNVSASETG